MVRAYAVAAVLLGLIGIVGQLFADGKTIDLFYRDTYYVLAPLYVTCAGALLLGLFAVISLLYEKLAGFKLGMALGYVHLGATATSVAVTVIAGLLMASYATVPHPAGESGTLWIALLIAFYAIFPAQILFPINLAWSWWRGRRAQTSRGPFSLST